jgi:hypothetical protein
MKDSRKGESLWFEWDGYSYPRKLEDSSIVYFTYDHVDLDHEVVRRALASSIQRDGVVSSLRDAFKLLDSAAISQGYAGEVNGNYHLTYCQDDGSTINGDEVAEVLHVTYVEVHDE